MCQLLCHIIPALQLAYHPPRYKSVAQTNACPAEPIMCGFKSARRMGTFKIRKAGLHCSARNGQSCRTSSCLQQPRLHPSQSSLSCGRPVGPRRAGFGGRLGSEIGYSIFESKRSRSFTLGTLGGNLLVVSRTGARRGALKSTGARAFYTYLADTTLLNKASAYARWPSSY